MLKELKELWAYRELLWTMVEREIRIRYKNSFLGFLWSLINPLVTVAVMTFVFTKILRNDTPSFSAYVLAAYLPFTAFQFALLDSSQSVLGSLPIIRKVYFPREIMPLASVISNFIHFLLSLGVFFLFLLGVYMLNPGQLPFPKTLVLLPVLLVFHFALTLGFALIVSALNTFYEDVKYILSISLYLLFFLTPVMYFSEQVAHAKGLPDWAFTLFMLNPVALMCTLYRQVMLDPPLIRTHSEVLPNLALEPWLIGLGALVSLLTLVGGYAFFNRVKWKFVERP